MLSFSQYSAVFRIDERHSLTNLHSCLTGRRVTPEIHLVQENFRSHDITVMYRRVGSRSRVRHGGKTCRRSATVRTSPKKESKGDVGYPFGVPSVCGLRLHQLEP